MSMSMYGPGLVAVGLTVHIRCDSQKQIKRMSLKIHWLKVRKWDHWDCAKPITPPDSSRRYRFLQSRTSIRPDHDDRVERWRGGWRSSGIDMGTMAMGRGSVRGPGGREWRGQDNRDSADSDDDRGRRGTHGRRRRRWGELFTKSIIGVYPSIQPNPTQRTCCCWWIIVGIICVPEDGGQLNCRMGWLSIKF